ncbi:MAG TPA: DUF2845 domain-containing protein [Rhodanobacter sp.]|jgi:hypothetical protein|nr:DUF2845 domain-containing protein [Rhodanobacter sp.]
MRATTWGFILLVLLALPMAAPASSTLRVGNQVLTAGDSSERVTALLGRPTSKSHRRKARRRAAGRGGVRVLDNHAGGEQWRYRRRDHVTVVTIVEGRVVDIDDRRI